MKNKHISRHKQRHEKITEGMKRMKRRHGKIHRKTLLAGPVIAQKPIVGVVHLQSLLFPVPVSVC